MMPLNKRILQKEPMEIEVKFYLCCPSKLIHRLISSGAVLISGRELERNKRFDTPDGVLRSTDQVLRLREDHQFTLTFKGSGNQTSEAAVRKELEVVVSSISTAEMILNALGYQVILTYEKYRATYEFQQCQIVLDELPYGSFCEIEGDSIHRIKTTAKRLGLDWNRRITSSYSGLFQRCKETRGLKFRDLSFEHFEGLKISPEDLGVLPGDSRES